MKTITRTLIASLAATLLLGTAAVAQAQDARSFFAQVNNSLGRNIQTPQNLDVRLNNRFDNSSSLTPGANPSKYRYSNQPRCGVGYCPPPRRPDCGSGYCPPPRPVCYVYIVYYYDCHCGWKFYREFHRECDAQHAVHGLQAQGYRAYSRQSAR